MTPPLGWMIGAVLVVYSRQWSRRDKLTGIVGIPLATMVVAVGLGAVSNTIPNVGPIEAVVLAAIAMGPVGVAYLLWRLEARYRARGQPRPIP